MKLIYALQHNVTKRVYVGCTGRTGRIKSHIAAAKNGRHKVELINEDASKHGPFFTAYRLEVIPDEFAGDRERYWMHYFDTGNPDHGYNYKDYIARKSALEDFPLYSSEAWLMMLRADEGYYDEVDEEE